MRRFVAVGAVAAMTLAGVQRSTGAESTPPTGCTPWMMVPSFVATCDGMIFWGAPHGVARVHSVVWVDPPRVSAGMTVTYAWKVGSTYTYGHHYYGIGWAALGSNLSVKVLVRTRHGGFARYYIFGVVRPLAG